MVKMVRTSLAAMGSFPRYCSQIHAANLRLAQDSTRAEEGEGPLPEQAFRLVGFYTGSLLTEPFTRKMIRYRSNQVTTGSVLASD